LFLAGIVGLGGAKVDFVWGNSWAFQFSIFVILHAIWAFGCSPVVWIFILITAARASLF